jgi:putative ABC transport system substrate-binding protein
MWRLGVLTQLAMAKPDVIIAVAPRAIAATMKAAPQTPIVASFTTDLGGGGEAASLSRPGGKVTGIAMLSF